MGRLVQAPAHCASEHAGCAICLPQQLIQHKLPARAH